MSKVSKKPEIQCVLEVPPVGDLAPQSATLFRQDNHALASAKLSSLEALWSLALKEISYSDFMREFLLVFMKVVRSEAGSILELDQQNQVLFFRATVGTQSEKLDRFQIPLGTGIVGYVAESKEPLIVSSVADNQVHLQSIQKAIGFEARNLIALPILVRGRVFGVLELLNRLDEPEFSDQDVETLTYLMEFASRALEVRLMLSWANKIRTIGIKRAA